MDKGDHFVQDEHAGKGCSVFIFLSSYIALIYFDYPKLTGMLLFFIFPHFASVNKFLSHIFSMNIPPCIYCIWIYMFCCNYRIDFSH